jgi:hypothetical protein
MAFIDQVQDLTSITVSDNAELSQFLSDGVIDITNKILEFKPDDYAQFLVESPIQDANGADFNGARIVSVIREAGADGSSDGSTAFRDCRQVTPDLQSRVTDKDSLHYASKFNPVYILKDSGKVYVYPVPDGTDDGYRVYYINNEPVDSGGTALAHDDTTIKYFPNDKIYLVILYAGMRLIQAKMGEKTAGLSNLSIIAVPPEPPTLSDTSISFSATAPTFHEPSTDITGTTWASAFPSDAGNVTTALTAMNNQIDTALTKIGDLYDTTVNFNNTNKDFELVSHHLELARNILESADSWDQVSANYGSSSGEGIGTGNVDQIEKSVAGWLKDEDPEMAQATLAMAQQELSVASQYISQQQALKEQALSYVQVAQAYGSEVQSRLSISNTRISEYGSKVQVALHNFNKENAEYQAQLQIAIQNAQLTNQDESNELTKYSAEMAQYTQEVASEVQEYQQNLAKDTQYYTWLQQQYTQFKQEYDGAFAFMAPQQQQRQAK